MAPLSAEFSRQEYWSGWPLPSPGAVPDPGIEPGSPVLQADSLPSEPPGKPHHARGKRDSSGSHTSNSIASLTKSVLLTAYQPSGHLQPQEGAWLSVPSSSTCLRGESWQHLVSHTDNYSNSQHLWSLWYVLCTVSTACTTYLCSSHSQEVGYMNSILWIRTQRHREVSYVAQGHTKLGEVLGR